MSAEQCVAEIIRRTELVVPQYLIILFDSNRPRRRPRPRNRKNVILCSIIRYRVEDEDEDDSSFVIFNPKSKIQNGKDMSSVFCFLTPDLPPAEHLKPKYV